LAFLHDRWGSGMKRKGELSVVLAACLAVAVTTGIIPQQTHAQTGPSITLETTVAIYDASNPYACGTENVLRVPAGTEVLYCFRATNTGETTFTTQALEDDQFGSNGFPVVLVPGQGMVVFEVATIDETTTNTATWIAANPSTGLSASATATATVTVLPPSIYAPMLARN